MLKRIVFSIAFLFLAGVLGYNFKTDPYTKEAVKTGFLNNYKVYALPIPDNLTLVDEPVPVHQKDVKERIDRELLVNTYWQSNGLLLLKRKNKFFPVIEPILKKEGVPDDFKYLAVAESGLQNVTSPAGAKGFWQIMKKTAKEYGLEVNDEVDERYNLEKATKVACQYLKNGKEKFGSWTLAAASYNAGMTKISSELERQKASNYYDLLLTSETARYVPRIIALKHILEHPKDFGFVYSQDDLYTPYKYKEVSVDSAISSLPDFAKEMDMSYKELKLLNPWLRSDKLTNKHQKTYYIKVIQR
ncbi:MAG TPA: lytic transglycosylase domain-containing protein [Flavobacteriales bacterium]|jgi:hypothetical protein|nr:lytic transglycosylase domain-containing protein [Flavobacteriales bacterium]